MVEFWRTLRTVPVDLAFMRGEKLEEESLRWAPRSLLRQDLRRDAEKTLNVPFAKLFHGEGDAKCTDSGLRFACRGFDLRASFVTHIKEGIWFKSQSGTWYRVWGLTDLAFENLRTPRSDGCPALMLISDQHDSEGLRANDWRLGRAQGILVHRNVLSEDCYYVSLICHVEFHEVRSELVLKGLDGGAGRNGPERSGPIWTGVEELGGETEWCLD